METPIKTSATAAKGAATLRRVDTQLRRLRLRSSPTGVRGDGRRVVSSEGMAS